MTGTLLVLFATLFWALDTLIRYPLLELGLTPVQIVFIEHILLVLVMIAWQVSRRQTLWPFKRKDISSLIVIGGLGSAIGTLCFTEAFSYMNPTLVILLQKLQPLVAISLSAWLLKERIHTSYVLCVLLAFSGSFFLMYEDITTFLQSNGWHYSAEFRNRLIGYMFTLIAVVSWGASTVFGKKLALSGYGSSQIMTGRFVFGLLFLLPFVFMANPFEVAITLSVFQKIALMVAISGVLGMVFYYQGLKRIDSKHSAIAEMGFPVMAGLINWWVLDFHLSALQLIGGGLLIASSFAVHLNLSRSKIPIDKIKKTVDVI